MTTRIYFDNQTNIQFRLTDSDGHRYANIMPLNYYSLDLPYYGIGAKLERVFTLTSKTYSSPGIIHFSINNYGTLSAYNIPVPITDNIQSTTVVSTTSSNVSTLTALNPSAVIQLPLTPITPSANILATTPIKTTIVTTSVSVPMNVNVAITKQNGTYIQSSANLGMNTQVVPTQFVSNININTQLFNTFVIFTGFTYDRTNSQ